MFQASHRTLLIISGLVWMAVGLTLLNTGLVLMMSGFQTQPFSADAYSGFFTWFAQFVQGPDNAAISLIALSLAIGFFKGRLVLQKAAAKSFDRIRALANPTPITNLYTKQNLMLLGGMMFLGMSMRFLNPPCDIRGAIDVAVGCALMQGAVSYFQYAAFYTAKQKTVKEGTVK